MSSTNIGGAIFFFWPLPTAALVSPQGEFFASGVYVHNKLCLRVFQTFHELRKGAAHFRVTFCHNLCHPLAHVSPFTMSCSDA
jgi:hypothetical protein